MIRRALAVLAALLLAVGLASCSSDPQGSSASATKADLNDQPSGSPYEGFGLVPPQPRPSFTLTDTTGRTFSFGTQTAHHPTLLFFGYTNCPDVCPTTLFDIAQALGTVPGPVRATADVVFVSTDVKHDTGPVIAAWLDKFDGELARKFIGLRGTQTQVDAAQAAAHIQLAEDGGQQHSAAVLLYGADDYAHIEFLQSTNQADQIAHDLPLVAS